MTTKTTHLAARSLLAASVVLAAGLATGCGSSHGKYTGEFKAEREAAKATIKSATAYDMAHQAYLAGDLEKAMKKIEESISMNDEVAKSHVLRGRILLELTDFGEAIESLDRAAELDESYDEAYYFKGVIFERIARLEEALESYRRAASVAPANAQYAVAVAEVLIDMDEIERARRYLSSEDTAFQHNAGVCQTLGHIAMMQGEPQIAVEKFEQARLLAPDSTAIMEDLARAQMRVGKFAEAEYTLSSMLEALGEDAAQRRDLMHLRSQCLMQVDRPVEAREVLLELTGDDAGQADTEAWIALGNVAYKLGDQARLRTASSRIVALSPNRFEGFMLRALWERGQGQPVRALRTLSKAIELRGDDVTPLVVKGIIQREMGDMASARESLQQAWLEDSENETVRRFLALLDRQAEQADEAVANVPEEGQ